MESTKSDKLLFIASEVKENFSLEQSEFQRMISGEDIPIAQEISQTNGNVTNQGYTPRDVTNHLLNLGLLQTKEEVEKENKCQNRVISGVGYGLGGVAITVGFLINPAVGIVALAALLGSPFIPIFIPC